MLHSLRVCSLATCLCAAVAHAASSLPDSPRLREAIPPQALSTALAAFEEQTNIQYGSEADITGLRSKGARAGLRPSKALEELLKGTGLRFKVLTERAVTIYAPRTIQRERAAAPAGPLEEVIVTAKRREEKADKVPIDAFVWTQEAIEASGVKSIADIGALTPGVEFDFFSSVGSGVYTNMAIRGVTDRHGTATGLFIDDIPVPPVRSNTFGRAFPFYFDLDRIEVLRGPQGTFLGAGTEGGAVRFVPKQPDLDQFTGLAHAEWATTTRGDSSYEVGSAVGGPLVPDTLGYRVSGWYRSDGGYVDRVNPFNGAVVDPNSNRTAGKSVRLALNYAPSDAVRIIPALYFVSVAGHDSPSFFTYLSNPTAGTLANGSLLRQPFDDQFYLTTLKTTANLGATELATVTAYFDRTGSLTIDDTESVKWGGWGNPLGPAYPWSYSQAVTTSVGLKQRLFSQEMRLTSRESSAPFSWVVAFVYSAERYREADRVFAQFIQAPIPGPLDQSDTTTTVQTQIATFAELRRNVGQFTMDAGVRLEREDYDTADIWPPVFRAHAVQTLVVPTFALSYERNEHEIYYSSVAKGYEPSGVDAALPTCFLHPAVYPTDTLWSYELGTKHALLGGRAHVDASVFHIRWNNGPAVTGNCLFTHAPGSAASDGFDLEAQAPVPGGLTAAVDLSYTDARYTETVTANGVPVVRDGDALGTPPLVTSPWNARVSLEQRISLRNGAVARVRAEDIFHSRNGGPFYTSIVGSPYYAPGLASDPSTNVLNLRADLKFAEFELAIFLNNALDSQPTLLKRNKGNDLSSLFYATTFRPRTAGLSTSWHF